MHERNQTMGHTQTITHIATQNVCIMYHVCMYQMYQELLSSTPTITPRPAQMERKIIQPGVHGGTPGVSVENIQSQYTYKSMWAFQSHLKMHDCETPVSSPT